MTDTGGKAALRNAPTPCSKPRVRKAEDEESNLMTTKQFYGDVFVLPYRGRFGCQIRHTLNAIMQNALDGGNGIALYAAMALRGKARTYAGRYEAAFARFAEVNKDKLQSGRVGPRGGFGYRYVGR